MSTLIDFPCGCSASELFSNRLEATLQEMNLSEAQQLSISVTQSEETSTTVGIIEADESAKTTPKLLLNDDDEIENINDVIDNPNSLLDPTTNVTDNSTIPLRIIIPIEHVHFDENSQTYFKYEHIILRSDDQNYHEHFNAVGETLIDIKSDRLQNFTENMFVGNNSLSDIKKLSDGKILINYLGFAYKVYKQRGENFYEILPLEYDVVQHSPYRQLFGVKQHYQQLNKWLNYAL